jgi:hypothetical protein
MDNFSLVSVYHSYAFQKQNGDEILKSMVFANFVSISTSSMISKGFPNGYLVHLKSFSNKKETSTALVQTRTDKLVFVSKFSRRLFNFSLKSQCQKYLFSAQVSGEESEAFVIESCS